MKSKRKGGSNMEIVMTMALLLLFGAVIYTLVYAGAETQNRIVKDRDVKINVRVALSYIDVKLKKYDEEGAISIEKNPFTQENALVFRDEPNPEYTNEELFTWIFYEDGVLYTQTITKDDALVSGLGIEIAKVDGFQVDLDGNILTSVVEYFEDGERKEMKNVSVIRSFD